jgi:hypothetical protein
LGLAQYLRLITCASFFTIKSKGAGAAAVRLSELSLAVSPVPISATWVSRRCVATQRFGRVRGWIAALQGVAGFCQIACAETVQVKYHGAVSLASFGCSDVNEGRDISRICCDKAETYRVIRLKAVYYHCCEMDPATVQGLLGASSKRQFFATRIKGNGTDGPFDCRTHPIPKKYRV